MKTDLIQTRDMAPTDVELIFSTWLNGLYYGNSYYREIEKNSYFFHYHRACEALLKRATVRVACLKEDPDCILGYAVFEYRGETPTLHWVYVKPAWRKLGVARALIPESIQAVTHLTKVGKAIMPKTWKFDPFLM